MSKPSYGEALRAGTDRLIEAGSDYPREEARAFLVWVCDLSTIDLISSENDPVPAEMLTRYHDALAQRISGQPLQHIVGYSLFYGLRLKTDARALIPRSDSECVVDLALQFLPARGSAQIADLGTGTGALLAAVLSARPQIAGVGVEASNAASDLAEDNLETLDLSQRADVFRGSWTEWAGWADADLIISNPPYIASDVIASLAPEVRDYEPVGALDGGADGLDAYREIINLAAQMRSGAHLVLEIGYDQKATVTTLLQTASFSHIVHRQDLDGHDRAIAATAP